MNNTIAAVMVVNSILVAQPPTEQIDTPPPVTSEGEDNSVDSPNYSPHTGGIQINAQCSAYVAGPGARTRTGTTPLWGTVAVDPSVIALGSRMLIAGFEGDVFRAEDTGGAVRGNRVDIYMTSYSQAIQYGRRPCTVTVLPVGGGGAS